MNIKNQFRILYKRIVGSIAFLPGIIALCFLILSIIMLEIDFSSIGTNLKTNTDWLRLKDASTARSIISTIAAALLSLTVFSFSMVMIVLNQAASQMSNRVLTSMIQNRFQQIVLGCYIGTIVYALTILSTIRDTSNNTSIPSLSIYLLIVLTVIAIFMFIYFLDYVTKTVKYETVIDRVEKKTLTAISGIFETGESEYNVVNSGGIPISVPESGYFQGFNKESLLKAATENDMVVQFRYKRSSFLLKDTVLLEIFTKKPMNKEMMNKVINTVDLYNGQPIDQNADYGCLQLAEIAIKALSPGINDPATAVLSLNALTNVLANRLYCKQPEIYKDNHNTTRIYCPSSGFEEIFHQCILPIWKYGKNDQFIQQAMYKAVMLLKESDVKNVYHNLLDQFLLKINEKIEEESTLNFLS
ncbi:DUF2254 domain-containing protein [Flavobacterium alkalisoli]|uniref:DUF2254 domain-containing protein n=1 Tax=Flavobacterium alkalisoli TaxID=2602769 RepID=A0A5B9FV09_9FLAO|nr:DUF2254 domain-containing protein [Flavobacterium alkalisoli]QEE50795.1 DUF2254 domain-containing protein [Flavobacterium alkalisoli]